jgi:hypothetical protein
LKSRRARRRFFHPLMTATQLDSTDSTKWSDFLFLLFKLKVRQSLAVSSPPGSFWKKFAETIVNDSTLAGWHHLFIRTCVTVIISKLVHCSSSVDYSTAARYA